MRTVAYTSWLFIFFLLSGCAGSRISEMGQSNIIAVPVKVIALDPSGGLFADAVGVELLNLGYEVIDTATTSRMITRLNLTEIEVNRPTGLQKLKDQGIDAYLSVRATSGRDGVPNSAIARINNTSTGKIIAGVTWQNGWGGQSGSIADRTMRKGLSEAVTEISTALSRHISKEN